MCQTPELRGKGVEGRLWTADITHFWIGDHWRPVELCHCTYLSLSLATSLRCTSHHRQLTLLGLFRLCTTAPCAASLALLGLKELKTQCSDLDIRREAAGSFVWLHHDAGTIEVRGAYHRDTTVHSSGHTVCSMRRTACPSCVDCTSS